MKSTGQKARPILFSAPMVCAILAGTKTQTRRVVNPQPQKCHMVSRDMASPSGYSLIADAYDDEYLTHRFGVSGDLLWVKETWNVGADKHNFYIEYRADSDGVAHQHDRSKLTAAEDVVLERWQDKVQEWNPSIFMPRWASRITLEITGIRAERLQAITPQDAIAEGLKGITKDGKLVKYGIPDRDGYPGTDNTGWEWADWRISPVDAYQRLWESINGPGSWERNDFVWVIEFKRVANA